MTKISPLDLENLNREYSPSSCIDDINIYIQQYIDLSKAAKQRAIDEKSILSDLPYGTTNTQTVDLYLPTSLPSDSIASYDSNTHENVKEKIAPKNKLMVYIHGGYWQELSKEESSFAATYFQQQGYHFAVIDYTLAPNASLTEIVEENRQAIACLYKNAAQFGYNPEEIYVSGSSAGAHLAMMMLQTNWQNYINDYQGNIIKGVCAVSGIYDLQPLVPTYVNDPIKMDDDEAKANSPALLPLPKPVPVIIAFGSNETQAFKEQSQLMGKKLTSAGFNVQFKEITERNHFDVILDLADSSSWLSQQTLSFMV